MIPCKIDSAVAQDALAVGIALAGYGYTSGANAADDQGLREADASPGRRPSFEKRVA